MIEFWKNDERDDIGHPCSSLTDSAPRSADTALAELLQLCSPSEEPLSEFLLPPSRSMSKFGVLVMGPAGAGKVCAIP